MTRKQYFLSGLKDGMPICFGYFAVSFAFGIQAAGIGLSVFEASVLSALNVTSAGQFAALAIIASGNRPCSTNSQYTEYRCSR